jgi:hypothetical protein
MSEWAAEIGIGESTLRYRIDAWGLEEALTTPRLAMSQTRPGKKRIRNRKFTEEEVAIVTAGWIDGDNIDHIARKVNSSRKTITRLLVRLGLKKFTPWVDRKRTNRKKRRSA